MASTAYRRWSTVRARALDEMARAHVALGGTGPGRRYATQQVNQAYAVLLASQFQGFCRELHSECVTHVLQVIAPPPALWPLAWAEFTRGRRLDRGNANPDGLKEDFERLGIKFWPEVEGHDPRNTARRAMLEELNRWRNAIVHQDLDPAKLGGSAILRLAQVRQWRRACHRLPRSFDAVLHRHLQTQTGAAPW
jgi:hypothetical protein